MKNRWIGWFRPVSRGRRIGSLIFTPIRIVGDREKSPVVITVPRPCGTAVQRNRFRRIVRAYLEKVGAARKPAWIRLSPEYRLGRKISIEDWQAALDKGLSVFDES